MRVTAYSKFDASHSSLSACARIAWQQLAHQVAWIIFFAISSVISVVSLAMKARIFIAQLRETRHIALDLSDEQTVHEKKMEEHREKLVEITHEIHLLCARGQWIPEIGDGYEDAAHL